MQTAEKEFFIFVSAILIYLSMKLANWSNILLEYMDGIGVEK